MAFNLSSFLADFEKLIGIVKAAEPALAVVGMVDPAAGPIVGLVDAGINAASAAAPAVQAGVSAVESNAPDTIKAASVAGDAAQVASVVEPALPKAAQGSVQEFETVAEGIEKAI